MRRFVIIGLLAFAPASFAVPIVHDVTFNPGAIPQGLGPAGVGSFTWDSETLLLTNFTWNFGGGLTGGLNDSILGLPLYEYTWGGLLYEQLTGIDVLPHELHSFGFGFGGHIGTFPGPDHGVIFGAYGQGTYEFSYRGPGGEDYRPIAAGALTVTEQRSVPEPATWTLLIAGFAGVLLARRRVTPSR